MTIYIECGETDYDDAVKFLDSINGRTFGEYLVSSTHVRKTAISTTGKIEVKKIPVSVEYQNHEQT